jgi:hypothetical protein
MQVSHRRLWVRLQASASRRRVDLQATQPLGPGQLRLANQLFFVDPVDYLDLPTLINGAGNRSALIDRCVNQLEDCEGCWADDSSDAARARRAVFRLMSSSNLVSSSTGTV